MPIWVAFLSVLQVILSTSAFAQEAPVSDCDKYAASDVDSQRKATGVPFDKINPALAIPACESAVQQYPNSIRLTYQLGRAYQKARNFKEALEQYRKAAEQGSPFAQNDLGNLYFNGQGIPHDFQQAISLYRKAADQGMAAAQYNLGFMYRHGLGVPQDYQQALAWYLKSAEQGWAQAQTELGLMYATGLGLPRDYQKAFAYYLAAANQGVAAAQRSLGIFYKNGYGVPQDSAQALAWYRKAAQQGDQEAIANLHALGEKVQEEPQAKVQAEQAEQASSPVHAQTQPSEAQGVIACTGPLTALADPALRAATKQIAEQAAEGAERDLAEAISQHSITDNSVTVDEYVVVRFLAAMTKRFPALKTPIQSGTDQLKLSFMGHDAEYRNHMGRDAEYRKQLRERVLACAPAVAEALQKAATPSAAAPSTDTNWLENYIQGRGGCGPSRSLFGQGLVNIQANVVESGGNVDMFGKPVLNWTEEDIVTAARIYRDCESQLRSSYSLTQAQMEAQLRHIVLTAHQLDEKTKAQIETGTPCTGPLADKKLRSAMQSLANVALIVSTPAPTDDEIIAHFLSQIRLEFGLRAPASWKQIIITMQSEFNNNPDLRKQIRDQLAACIPAVGPALQQAAYVRAKLAEERDQAGRRQKEFEKQQELKREEARRQQAEQAEQDRARGYQSITVETFVLDRRDLASKATKVSLGGVYIRQGNLDVLYANVQAAMIANSRGLHQPNVPLLTDHASREFRLHLLKCQSNPASAEMGCPVTVLGRVITCKLSNAYGAAREEPCVAVEDGRQ